MQNNARECGISHSMGIAAFSLYLCIVKREKMGLRSQSLGGTLLERFSNGLRAYVISLPCDARVLSHIVLLFNFSCLMINYSLSPRAVDPSKQDGEKRYYPNAQTAKNMQLDEFATHISKHGSPYHRSDISAVLTRSVDCLREMLLDGNKVCLGDLGNFYVRLESKGAVSVEKFNPATDILSVKVYWEPGPLFRDLINDAEFLNVATRRAQDATLKAERAGMTTVDISKAGSSGNSGGTGNSGGSENSGGTGGSGNSGSDSGSDEELPPVIGGDENGGGGDDEVIDNGD